jgi:hypothetical protein
MAVQTGTRTDGFAGTAADTVAFGERFGLFRELSECGPATAGELARRSGGAGERTVREWLTAAVSGDYLTYDATTDRYANSCPLPGASRN